MGVGGVFGRSGVVGLWLAFEVVGLDSGGIAGGLLVGGGPVVVRVLAAATGAFIFTYSKLS